MSNAGTPPSGESLKTLEFRLTSKVADRQTSFGQTWESIFKFCLRVENKDAEVDAVWRDMTPRDEATQQTMVIERVDKLNIPVPQALKELGYTDEEITKFEEWQRTKGVIPQVAQ